MQHSLKLESVEDGTCHAARHGIGTYRDQVYNGEKGRGTDAAS
jgi:hypothetical protein